MYNMMIIDDEEIVRNGLKRLIEWEEYGFTICAEGMDGLDGLEKILQYNPSLVLVDLKMPGLNGIEVIKKAREQGYAGTFYILTGYSDFEFAKSAISLGVKEYLLKPIDEEELQNNIIQLKQTLDLEKEKNKSIDQDFKSSRKEILRQMLLYVNEEEFIRENAKYYGFDTSYPVYCVAMICSGDDKAGIIELPSKESLDIILSGIKEEVESVNIEDKWALVFMGGGGYKEYLEKLSKNNERLRRLKGDMYFIAIGHDVTHFTDLHYSYECAKLLLDYRFSFEEEFAVSIQKFEVSVESGERDFSHVLYPFVEIGDEEGIKNELSKIKEDCKLCLMKESDIKMMFSHNLCLLYIMLEEKYPEKKAEIPEYQALVEAIKALDTLEELIEVMEMNLSQLSRIVADADSTNVVKRVYAYMEKNYQNELKLESISKVFNYNSAYLGKIFKREMGESFNNVIDRIRIENAKKLLTETNMKVYQVSEKVGYANIDYFYSKFKRYVGISPREFKKQAQEEVCENS